MKATSPTLRTVGTSLIGAAFILGCAAAWLWSQSNADWRAHQQAANAAGVTIYYAMQNGTAPPEGSRLVALEPADQMLAEQGQFRQIAGVPAAARITNVPISADAANLTDAAPAVLVILSPSIAYPIADLPHRQGQTAAETFGAVAAKLAALCSDPVVLAKMGDDPWLRVEASEVWGCDAAPSDRRLPAVFMAAIGLGIMITVLLNLSSAFSSFAGQLMNRQRLGGPTSYKADGPHELQEIVTAVNNYLEAEREQLASRAAVLSGVSHDLGTPATRLRLRAALIPDPALRNKFETDIDRMTGIIESVLTYTQAEMSAEAPRKLSLTALVEAIVADYQDVGRPVKLDQARDIVVQGGRSIFMSRQGQSTVSQDRDVVVIARPILLQRAITNLIDNAIKYGRRATVSIEADRLSATIVVQDEGTTNSARDIEVLLEPFQRGENTATIDGHGLGLTIVATIAKLHGGGLEFEDRHAGVAARLSIQRS